MTDVVYMLILGVSVISCKIYSSIIFIYYLECDNFVVF